MQNKPYLTILRNLKIDQINNEEIVTLLYPPHQDSNSGHTINAENSESSMIMLSDRFEDYSQMIRLQIDKNWSIGSLFAKFGLPKKSWLLFLIKTKKIISQQKIENISVRAFNKRKHKQVHNAWILDLLKNSRYKRWTLNMIKQELINEYKELNSISSSTIVRCFKKDLKYSYKILEWKLASALTHDWTRRLLVGALIQKLLN